MERVTTFITTYKMPLLIAVAGLILIILIYRYFGASSLPEGFYGAQYGGYPAGYQRYPQYEGFYDEEGEAGPDPDQEPEQGPEPEQEQGPEPDNGVGNMEGFYAQEPRKRLILFFANWCHFCKDLKDGAHAPWSQLERKYSGHPKVTIEKVDCEANPEVATKYGIKGYPTIKMFHGDRIINYDGDRSIGSLERFIENPDQAS